MNETKTKPSYFEWQEALQRDPEVQRGAPCFPDSRLPVYTIGWRLVRGDTPEMLKEEYPYLTELDLKFSQLYVKHDPEGKAEHEARQAKKEILR